VHYVIVQDFVKVGQTVLAISRLFRFDDDRHSPSWIFSVSNFWSPIGLGKLICTIAANNVKITGGAVAPALC